LVLKTELSALERQFIERRLNEEKSAMESLATSGIPITVRNPKTHYAAASGLDKAIEQHSTDIHRYGGRYSTQSR